MIFRKLDGVYHFNSKLLYGCIYPNEKGMWLRLDNGHGFQIKHKSSFVYFSERIGKRKPDIVFLGFKLFVLKPGDVGV